MKGAIRPNAMEMAVTRVRTHMPNDEEEGAAMLSLLAEAGCKVIGHEDPAVPAATVSADIEAPDECPPLVLLLPRDGIADAAFDEAVLEAVQAGCRVVGLWPSDGSGGVPACFDDYGGDTVPWHPDRLGQAVTGKPQHRTTDDTATDVPNTDRHICK